jgi:hypothetical protein
VKQGRPYLWLLGLLIAAWLGSSWYVARVDSSVRAVKAYEQRLRPLLSSDADFAKVQVTGKGDSVTIHGHIADQTSFARLRSMVVGTHPPVKVVFHLNAEDSTDGFFDVIPLVRP